MKKEFGKWLLDIAKYMVTALLLSTIFADLQEPIILYIVAIFSFVLLIAGLAVIYNSELEDKNKRKKVKNEYDEPLCCFCIGGNYYCSRFSFR